MEKNPLQISQLLSAERKVENYDEIILSEQEAAESLRLARKQKYTEIKTKEYWDKVKKESSYPKYTAEQFYDIIIKKAKETIVGFEVDVFNEQIIKQLCLYFTSDERFESKYNLSLRKGLYLFGGVGCGKTSLMNLFRSNQLSSFKIVSCDEISREYAINGAESIEQYYSTIPTSNYKLNFGQEQLGICFDDLGTEDVKKHFGNQSNVMADIILARYSRRHILMNKTHITTNLSTDEVEQYYGTRVKSRMREMFNLISFDENCPDRRK